MPTLVLNFLGVVVDFADRVIKEKAEVMWTNLAPMVRDQLKCLAEACRKDPRLLKDSVDSLKSLERKLSQVDESGTPIASQTQINISKTIQAPTEVKKDEEAVATLAVSAQEPDNPLPPLKQDRLRPSEPRPRETGAEKTALPAQKRAAIGVPPERQRAAAGAAPPARQRLEDRIVAVTLTSPTAYLERVSVRLIRLAVASCGDDVQYTVGIAQLQQQDKNHFVVIPTLHALRSALGKYAELCLLTFKCNRVYSAIVREAFTAEISVVKLTSAYQKVSWRSHLQSMEASQLLRKHYGEQRVRSSHIALPTAWSRGTLQRPQVLLKLSPLAAVSSLGSLLRGLNASNKGHLTRPVLPPNMVVYWCYQILRALECMHRISVAHCDIKPDNLALSEKGLSIRVIDFGSACHFDSMNKPLGPRQKERAPLLTTPAYAAPESIHPVFGRRDGGVDVWSLGITAYELLHGAAPHLCTASENKRESERLTHRLMMSLGLAAESIYHDADWLDVCVDDVPAGMPPAARTPTAQSFQWKLQWYVTPQSTQVQELRELISLCLTLDARRRPSAADLIKLPLFDVLKL
ncbi:MAG: hypothetical protein MHM6MM_006663 [Cercozoa sp. M6MM]